jgi:uncharacterized protein
MKIVILHGTGGNPEDNWFPWLKDILEDRGHEVCIPEFPTPENQSLKNWSNTLKDQVHFTLDKDTILIGHDLGANFILHILDIDMNEPVRKAILVSGFCNKLGHKVFDELSSTFIEKEFNWDRIKSNATEFIIYQGEGDPYVPIFEAEELEENLDAELNIIPDGQHLNEEAGVIIFEELLERIEGDL